MLKRMLIALAAAFGLWTGAALAQAYPTRPITIIVPFAAGGPTDVTARILGAHMSETLGQSILYENIIGAGGTAAITHGAQSAPDGYVIMIGHMGTHSAAPALYPDLKYDPTKDFEPIGLAAGTPILIVARKDFPPNDLKEFIAYLKVHASRLNQAHAGIASVSHITCLMLVHQIGVKLNELTYRGTGPALTSLIDSGVDVMCDQIVNLTEAIKSRRIKAYAIATSERSPALPDVPTTKEAGLPGFEVSAWNALFAPKGTPAPVVAKLTDALSKALDDPATRKRLLDLGGVIPGGTQRGGAYLGTFVAQEVARWTPIIKAAGVVGQ